MNDTETAAILAILKAAYPHSFKDMKKRDADATVALWQKMFANDSFSDVSAAIYALIATRTDGFSPTVGEVKEKLRMIRMPQELGELEAWSLVSRALQNGIYGYAKEYAKLPEEVQRAVGRPEQLRDWAMMDADTVQSVVASNFMRSFRVHQARAREISKLPPDVKNMLTGIAGKLAMPELESEKKI